MQPAEAPSLLTFIIPAPSIIYFHAFVRSRRGAVRLNRSPDSRERAFLAMSDTIVSMVKCLLRMLLF